MNPESRPGAIGFIFAPDGRVPDAAGLPWGIGTPLEERVTLAKLCVVPVGAPLFEHRSTVGNVELLANLAGRRCGRATAVHALRQVEVPDVLHGTTAAALQPVHRLCTWLAIARLTEPRIVVLENPFGALDAESRRTFAGLLVEASRLIQKVVVIGSDVKIARLLGAEVDEDLHRI